MIRAYLNEDVTRHPYSATDQWGSVTYGTDATIRARVSHRNIVVTNTQGEEMVSRDQITVAADQTVNMQDQFTVDGVRLSVVEIKKNQDFVVRSKEVRLV